MIPRVGTNSDEPRIVQLSQLLPGDIPTVPPTDEISYNEECRFEIVASKYRKRNAIEVFVTVIESE